MTFSKPKPKATDVRQGELQLSSYDADKLFEGRILLYVSEVARAMRCSVQHVINLIQEFEDSGGTRGIKGISIACGMDNSLVNQAGEQMPRNTWRVPKSHLLVWLGAKDASHLQP